MGYGAGGFLIVVGLILALAVQDAVEGVDLVMIGWIMTIVGVVLLLLTAMTLNRKSGAGAVQTTTHADGSVTERRTTTQHDI